MHGTARRMHDDSRFFLRLLRRGKVWVVASHFTASISTGLERWRAGSLNVVQVGLLKCTDTGLWGRLEELGEAARFRAGLEVASFSSLDSGLECFTFIFPFFIEVGAFFCFNALEGRFFVTCWWLDGPGILGVISALFRMTVALALFALIVAVVLFVVATSLFGVASTNLTSEGRTATFKAALLDRVLTCSSEGPGDRSTFRLTPDLHRDGVL